MKKILLYSLLLSGCITSKNIPVRKVYEKNEPVTANGKPAGITGNQTFGAANIHYIRNGKTKYKVSFKEPVVVSIASQPYKWGFFQFPTIGWKGDGAIQVKWNLAYDAMESYGSENSDGSAFSTDKGKTWKSQSRSEITDYINLANGDKLSIHTPKPFPLSSQKMPPSLKNNPSLYRLRDLPDSLKSVYFNRLKKGQTEWVTEKASLNDPDAVRYSLRGFFPIVWWGDIKVAPDQSLIAGIYPGGYADEKDNINRSQIFFYRSTDNGRTWNVQGRIPFFRDPLLDSATVKVMSYSEPAFEILEDGTFLCVIRTTTGAVMTPMVASYSKDLGKTWSTPVPISGAGVLPRLLQLDNGVTVLTSGRPGVQMRFSSDPNGLEWSDHFEMLPYGDMLSKDEKWNANVSCGYTGLLPIDRDRFLMVYSDFNFKNDQGELRKAIKVREIKITK